MARCCRSMVFRRLEEMKKDFVSCINISLHIVQFGFSGRVPESSVAVFDDKAADIIDALQCVDIFKSVPLLL